MSKKFKDTKEFITVASGIATDGTIMLSNFNEDKVQLQPEEKRFPYLKKASKLIIEEALMGMPTALRVELILAEYEYLLDDLNWAEVDGPNDYWPGKRTAALINKYPHLVDKADWNKLKNTWLASVLIRHPEMAERADFTKINLMGFMDLLRKQPQFAAHFDFKLINNKENSGEWFKLLKAQPQLADKCEWKFIDDVSKNKLLELHPEIIKHIK